MSRIVLACPGSLGDLLPFLALGRGLQARGHEVRVATGLNNALPVIHNGLEFQRLRPDPRHDDAHRDRLHSAGGAAYRFREVLGPSLRESFEDLVETARGADLLISNPSASAAAMAAEATGTPWAPAALQPIAFFSAFDASIPPHAAWAAPLIRSSPLAGLITRTIVRAVLARWTGAMATLRADLGLAPARDPMFNAAIKPAFALALFSTELARPQRDWPTGTRATGACHHDGLGLPPMPPEVQAWVDEGTPPVLVTLGSSLGRGSRGKVVQEAVTAATAALGLRSLSLAGATDGEEGAAARPDRLAVAYAPLGELTPQATAVVHHGGAGTLAWVLRAGKPSLVIPFTGEQFDHAARLVRRGVALSIPAHRVTPERVGRALARLRSDRRIAARAAEVGARVRQERGVDHAVEAIEAGLRTLRRA